MIIMVDKTVMDEVIESISGMVDISDKEVQKRIATAKGRIYLRDISMDHIRLKTNPKGDVLENAKLAAIHAVKKTPEMVFMCHPITISNVDVDFEVHGNYIEVFVSVTTLNRTGVEIEAVAGVMNSLLAIFDLSKRFEKLNDGSYDTAKISDIKVVKKIKS
ncbi:cyclic pyranopterin monophosphate synthase MoaC [archaeon]|nr:cyclic pyranopterin monophosphate synthase MoaC [archaeon]NDB56146.1 cyclic pyranopterin monophosphate synthase MoaC [archaeon]NDB80021.1 cyclic pyranopterin monophosphate synthase MoaC [archaeon]